MSVPFRILIRKVLRMPLYVRHRFRGRGAGYLGSHTLSTATEGDHYDVLDLDGQTGQPAFALSEFCSDDPTSRYVSFSDKKQRTGLEVDHDFLCEKLTMDGMFQLSGTFNIVPDTSFENFEHYVPENLREALSDVNDFLPDWEIWSHMPFETEFSPTTDIMGKAEPLKPLVNIPSFLFETLRDLPSLIFTRGHNFFAAVGSVNLQLQFGWKPLVKDLTDLWDISTALTKRARKIMYLKSVGTMRSEVGDASRVVFHESEEEIELPFSFYGHPGDPSAEYTGVVLCNRTTIAYRWGVVKYAITEDAWNKLEALSRKQIRTLSLRTLLGLYVRNYAGLWEALPWSWLVDWVIPIQRLLERYSGAIPLEVDRVNIMTRVETTITFLETTQIVDGDAGLINVRFPITIHRSTKRRDVLSIVGEYPNLVGQVKFLDLRRQGILASLLAGYRKK